MIIDIIEYSYVLMSLSKCLSSSLFSHETFRIRLFYSVLPQTWKTIQYEQTRNGVWIYTMEFNLHRVLKNKLNKYGDCLILLCSIYYVHIDIVWKHSVSVVIRRFNSLCF